MQRVTRQTAAHVAAAKRKNYEASGSKATPQTNNKDTSKSLLTAVSANNGLPRNAAEHSSVGGKKPSTQVMVDTALLRLKRRNGASIVAIKKFILAHYPIKSAVWLHRCVRRYLVESLVSMRIVRIKRSYKLSHKAKQQQRRRAIQSQAKQQRHAKNLRTRTAIQLRNTAAKKMSNARAMRPLSKSAWHIADPEEFWLSTSPILCSTPKHDSGIFT